MTKRISGEGTIRKNGYHQITVDGKLFLKHTVVAEMALGKPLPKGAEIHHFDGDKLNNKNSNLVICPSHSYHRLLHVRQRAYEECGDANKRKCSYCKKYDFPKNMRKATTSFAHKECERNYKKERYNK